VPTRDALIELRDDYASREACYLRDVRAARLRMHAGGLTAAETRDIINAARIKYLVKKRGTAMAATEKQKQQHIDQEREVLATIAARKLQQFRTTDVVIGTRSRTTTHDALQRMVAKGLLVKEYVNRENWYTVDAQALAKAYPLRAA
jgi:DNA-binding transcriptional regulator PaaX